MSIIFDHGGVRMDFRRFLCLVLLAAGTIVAPVVAGPAPPVSADPTVTAVAGFDEGPAIAWKPDGQILNIVARRSDGVIYERHWNSVTFTDWVSLGGRAMASAPAVAWKPDGSMFTIVARGYDGFIYERHWPGSGSAGYSDWVNIGAPGQFPQFPQITAVSVAWTPNGSGMYVVARGPEGTIYERHGTPTGGYTNWFSLGGTGTSGPAVAWSPSGVMDVAVAGTDGAVWLKRWTPAGYGPWTSLGGFTASAPALASVRSGTGVYVVIRAYDNSIHEKHGDPGAFSDWFGLGGTTYGAPSATWARHADYFDVAVRGTDNAIWQNSWRPTRGYSGWLYRGLVPAPVSGDPWHHYSPPHTFLWQKESPWFQAGSTTEGCPPGMDLCWRQVQFRSFGGEDIYRQRSDGSIETSFVAHFNEYRYRGCSVPYSLGCTAPESWASGLRPSCGFGPEIPGWIVGVEQSQCLMSLWSP
jgi:hypothetical protein